MFERFTDEARQVVVQAQSEARTLRHNWIGTEHVLLGLLGDQGGLAVEVLGSFGLELADVREDVVRIVGHGDATVTGQIPFTPRSKKVLELALREALSLGHKYIGPEHILLGLVRENEGVAARILLEHDVTADMVRDCLPHAPRHLHRGRGWRGQLAFRGRRQWEYLLEEDLATSQLNELGAEGWELVSAVPRGGAVLFILKRTAQPSAAEKKPAA